MAKLLYVRIAAALALCSLAFLVLSMDPFLNAAAIGPAVSSQPAAFTVNRFRKGDRLPLYPAGTVRQDLRARDGLQSRKKVPFACDPAFSPVTSPGLAKVYGRCMA